MRHTRLVIIDPHDLSRNGIQMLVSRITNLTLVASCRSLEEAFMALSAARPDVILLDDTVPRASEFGQVIERLADACPKAAIILLSNRLHGRYIQRVLALGVSGFFYREDRLEETLHVGIETVQQGHLYVSPRASGLVFAERSLSDLGQLTQTDLEVLNLLALGLSVKEVGTQLDLTTRSVYRIRAKLRAALGVHSDIHLLDAARTSGLINETGKTTAE